jgi:hypothetical protein
MQGTKSDWLVYNLNLWQNGQGGMKYNGFISLVSKGWADLDALPCR